MIMTVAAAASAAAFAAISADEAKRIAFEGAGVTAEEVSRLSVRQDYEDGRRIYDVEFIADGSKYDYEIGYEDGNIYSFDRETEYTFLSTAANVDSNTALSIALADAGFAEKEVSRTKVKRDYDDGLLKYEVEFRTNDNEYEYEIGENGLILSSSYEVRGRVQSNRNKTLLQLEEAEKLIQQVVPGSTLEEIRIKRDFDDGIYTYEGSIYSGEYEYEVTLDAATGKVLEYSKELLFY